jgi:hypothetical protein
MTNESQNKKICFGKATMNGITTGSSGRFYFSCIHRFLRVSTPLQLQEDDRKWVVAYFKMLGRHSREESEEN